jgi:hypothetical protein
MANNDVTTMKYFREYVRTCLFAFTSKCIPYFAGTLYRGVQMSAEELRQYTIGAYILFPSLMSTSKSLSLVTFRGTNAIFIIHTLTAA